MFLGCGLGRYGGQCTECLGCSTCDIESGKCGMYYLFLNIHNGYLCSGIFVLDFLRFL